MRLGSVPATLRNSLGYAGGILVGHMPQVSSDHRCFILHSQIKDHQIIAPKSEKHSPHFKNFKRTVYHGCFAQIIAGIRTASLIGEAMRCGDGVNRVIRPGVYILSADYEEQFVHVHLLHMCILIK
jgi:hypothetical protein